MLRRGALLAAALWLAAATGCGDDTPMGDELASPPQRDAVPDPEPDVYDLEQEMPEPVRPPTDPRIGGPVAPGEAPEIPPIPPPGLGEPRPEE